MLITQLLLKSLAIVTIGISSTTTYYIRPGVSARGGTIINRFDVSRPIRFHRRSTIPAQSNHIKSNSNPSKHNHDPISNQAAIGRTNQNPPFLNNEKPANRQPAFKELSANEQQESFASVQNPTNQHQQQNSDVVVLHASVAPATRQQLIQSIPVGPFDYDGTNQVSRDSTDLTNPEAPTQSMVPNEIKFQEPSEEKYSTIYEIRNGRLLAMLYHRGLFVKKKRNFLGIRDIASLLNNLELLNNAARYNQAIVAENEMNSGINNNDVYNDDYDIMESSDSHENQQIRKRLFRSQRQPIRNDQNRQTTSPNNDYTRKSYDYSNNDKGDDDNSGPRDVSLDHYEDKDSDDDDDEDGDDYANEDNIDLIGPNGRRSASYGRTGRSRYGARRRTVRYAGMQSRRKQDYQNFKPIGYNFIYGYY